ncbi:mRNA cap guanine-N7 methyltransferase [Ceratina calcarata]|uniref:mRNA cap guanine-N(7) methyltransferase n=1 Tax=Ceratina calcarata TaxID=156304 RepID=A0AAJ7J0Z5_9HYME|nr:mRNA cap guanine-N7 methyltransferase [Ceratina calcarata]
MSEVKEKQEKVLVEQDDEKKSPKTKRKRESEERSVNYEEVKNSRGRSPDPEPSKRLKYDTEQNTKDDTVSSTVDSNKEEKESLTEEVCNDNAIIVAKHYNSLENKNLAQRNRSRIIYLRNFNNWIKSMLITKFVEEIKSKMNHGSRMKVLDMCCGKGGDLFKWKKANISHLICIDLAEVTVQQCHDRYKDLLKRNASQRNSLFSAEFITADCTKVRLRRKFEDPSMYLDIVSCQFAFHYCFESLQQAECMIQNASECLKPGGYFIGTIPDAYDLVSRWQKCDGNSFGNDVYNVEFFCDKEKPPIFGAKYHFQLEGVVNCPEFLVYLPAFKKLALKFGLEMVLFERFDDFYDNMKDKDKQLLNIIQALEVYPPRDGPPVGDPDRDYQHAKEYLKMYPNYSQIGTLSKSEWEVTSLYAVFAFKKMKTVWNKDGEAEYVNS